MGSHRTYAPAPECAQVQHAHSLHPCASSRLCGSGSQLVCRQAQAALLEAAKPWALQVHKLSKRQ